MKAGRKNVAHDLSRTKRERELLGELEKKIDAELAALSARSTLSVDPGSRGHRSANDVDRDITQDRSAEQAPHSESGHHR